MTDNSETKTVSVDTENLDDFEALFSGKANLAEEKEESETPEEETPEDDALAPEETAEEEEEEAEEPAPKPKKKTAQERINELTRERREAERANAELLRRLEALESKGKTEEVKTVPEAKAPTPDDVDDQGEPKYPLGEFDPGYIRDNVKHILAEERKEIEKQTAAEREQSAAQAEFERISNDWSKKIENVEERLPGFAEKGQELEETFKNIDLAHGEFLASTIMSLEYGPEVLYYLSENLDVAEKIVNMSPTAAVVQLGRLETQFIPKEEKKPKVSAAPEPPAVSTRGTGSKVEIPVDTDDLDAFSEMYFKKKK